MKCATGELVKLNVLGSKNDLVYFPLKFGLVEICALVDTGASRSFVSQNILNDLLPYLESVKSDEKLLVVMPNNESVMTNECYLMKFKIGNVFIKHLFYVLDINSDIILGNDFLRTYQVQLDYEDMTACVSVNDDNVILPMVCKSFEVRDILSNLKGKTL